MLINQLPQLLTEHNVQMTRLARATGLHHNTIKKIVSTGNCRIESALRIARFFNKRVDEIFSLDEERSPGTEATVT